MKDEYLEVSRYSETLYFTQHGEWVLDMLDGRGQKKMLAPKQAEAWLKNRYPRTSWVAVIQRANHWLESLKTKQAGGRPERR